MEIVPVAGGKDADYVEAECGERGNGRGRGRVVDVGGGLTRLLWSIDNIHLRLRWKAFRLVDLAESGGIGFSLGFKYLWGFEGGERRDIVKVKGIAYFPISSRGLFGFGF